MAQDHWTDTRAVMLKVGDETPAGPVAQVELNGALRLVELELTDGSRFTRRFDDLVSVTS